MMKALNQHTHQIISIQADPFTKALSVMDNDHTYIHLGRKFNAFSKNTISAGGTLHIQITTPASSSKYIHFRKADIIPNKTEFDVNLYEDSTVITSGTTITPINMNRNCTSVSTVSLNYEIATASASGTLIDGFTQYLPGVAGSGALARPVITEEIVLKPSTTYTLVIVNGSGATAKVGSMLNWYEEDKGCV